MHAGEVYKKIEPQTAMPPEACPSLPPIELKRLVDFFLCLHEATRKIDEQDRKAKEAHAN